MGVALSQTKSYPLVSLEGAGTGAAASRDRVHVSPSLAVSLLCDPEQVAGAL